MQISQSEQALIFEALKYRWDINARDKQRMPAQSFFVWLILAGRGFGKTRTGAETVRQWVKHNPMVNLVGATADDARDIMIEGESGILAICPEAERPLYVASKRRLEWPNGAVVGHSSLFISSAGNAEAKRSRMTAPYFSLISIA